MLRSQREGDEMQTVCMQQTDLAGHPFTGITKQCCSNAHTC